MTCTRIHALQYSTMLWWLALEYTHYSTSTICMMTCTRIHALQCIQYVWWLVYNMYDDFIHTYVQTFTICMMTCTVVRVFECMFVCSRVSYCVHWSVCMREVTHLLKRGRVDFHCNTLRHNATHCKKHCNNSLQQLTAVCSTLQHTPRLWDLSCTTLQRTATHCDTLRENTATTRCNDSLQQLTATHCNTLAGCGIYQARPCGSSPTSGVRTFPTLCMRWQISRYSRLTRCSRHTLIYIYIRICMCMSISNTLYALANLKIQPSHSLLKAYSYIHIYLYTYVSS